MASFMSKQVLMVFSIAFHSSLPFGMITTFTDSIITSTGSELSRDHGTFILSLPIFPIRRVAGNLNLSTRLFLTLRSFNSMCPFHTYSFLVSFVNLPIWIAFSCRCLLCIHRESAKVRVLKVFQTSLIIINFSHRIKD